MSLRSTIMLSSRGQMYCCLSRPLHLECSRLNEIAAWLCVAEKSFTGMETRPNEIVPEAMERAGGQAVRRRAADRRASRICASPGNGRGSAVLGGPQGALARPRGSAIRRGNGGGRGGGRRGLGLRRLHARAGFLRRDTRGEAPLRLRGYKMRGA